MIIANGKSKVRINLTVTSLKLNTMFFQRKQLNYTQEACTIHKVSNTVHISYIILPRWLCEL